MLRFYATHSSAVLASQNRQHMRNCKPVSMYDRDQSADLPDENLEDAINMHLDSLYARIVSPPPLGRASCGAHTITRHAYATHVGVQVGRGAAFIVTS